MTNEALPVFSDLLQDHNYSRPMAVNTDTVNPADDWVLDVKLVWDREVSWTDLVHECKLRFDPSACYSTVGHG